MYDRHLLPSTAVDIPTICVGNLAAGGTGKTPMTAYIVRLLQDNGYRPAVLSRGYKRKTRGFVLADAHSTADTIGDEAMQQHTTFPEVSVAVCENRVEGVRRLEKLTPRPDAVVLDDAMQHRALRCGFTILLTPYDRLYIDDRMLPWGTLRDLPSRAGKADCVVVTKCPETIRPIDMRAVDNRLHLPTYQKLHFAGIQYAALQEKGVPLVLSGIAEPSYLTEHVRKHYPQAEEMVFADHHRYTARDVQAVIDRAKYCNFVLTTEKDMQRLRLTDLEERLQAQGKKLVAMPIRTHFYTPHADFDRQILNYLKRKE